MPHACGDRMLIRAHYRNATYTRTDPSFWCHCPGCGQADELRSGPCLRCGLNQQLPHLPDDGTGRIRPELQLLHQTLATTDTPTTVLSSSAKKTAAAVLSDLAKSLYQTCRAP